MLLNRTLDSHEHSSCALTYDEGERWFQALGQGYVDPAEARRGGQAYLLHAFQQPCPYLLNDTSSPAPDSSAWTGCCTTWAT